MSFLKLSIVAIAALAVLGLAGWGVKAIKTLRPH